MDMAHTYMLRFTNAQLAKLLRPTSDLYPPDDYGVIQVLSLRVDPSIYLFIYLEHCIFYWREVNTTYIHMSQFINNKSLPPTCYQISSGINRNLKNYNVISFELNGCILNACLNKCSSVQSAFYSFVIFVYKYYCSTFMHLF